jgi:hypothetical protein
VTDEDRKTIEDIRMAPTPTPVSALLRAMICHPDWGVAERLGVSDERRAIVFGLNHKSRMELATAFACVQREELRLTKEAVLEQAIRDLLP